MRRKLISGVAGVAILLGSALVAEAQPVTIQPTGPLAVLVTDTSEVYTATVTTIYSGMCTLTVLKNGTQVYGGQWFVINSGPSFNFQSPVLGTGSWGMAVGDTIDFRFWFTVGSTHRWTSDYDLTVQPGGTSMGPRQDSDWMMAAALPSRKCRDIDDLLGSDDGSLA
jgi:hypothetical protein